MILKFLYDFEAPLPPEGKLYALVEIAIAYYGWANIQEQYHAIKISKDTSSQILDIQVEILSI